MAQNKVEVADTVFARLEQIAPFPYDVVFPLVERYPNAQLLWVQEEPKNMGAWGFVKARFDTILRELELQTGKRRELITYIGRKPSASPATGSYKTHGLEQQEFIDRVFSNMTAQPRS